MQEVSLGSARRRVARRGRAAWGGILATTSVIVVAVAASAATLGTHHLNAGLVTSMTVAGVDGEGSNGHDKWIEVDSWSFGVSSNHAISSAGLGAGKPTFTSVTITKMVDKASPFFFRDCAAGTTLPTVAFTDESSASAPPGDSLLVTLSNVKVSGYSISSGGDRPSESVSFNFTKITMSYKRLGAAAFVGGWDLAKGKAV